LRLRVAESADDEPAAQLSPIPISPGHHQPRQLALTAIQWDHSRATDVNGNVQPTSEELAVKQTGLEDNSQFPRTVMVS
jgi:hypothetical protein